MTRHPKSHPRFTVDKSANGTPGTLQEFIAEAVSSAIGAGTLQAGERVSPEVVARDLGVSHIPVREALKVLEGQGLIRRIPRRGFFVTTHSLDELRDAYLWREVLEDEALRRGIPLLTSADITAMKRHFTEMARAVKSGDIPTFSRANHAFHFVVFERLGSVFLTRFLGHLWDTAVRYYTNELGASISLEVLQEQHRQIIEACENRDPERAVAITHAHRNVSLEALARSMSQPQTIR